jgi:antitoxin HigA-1
MTRSTKRVRTHPGEMLREEFMTPLGLSANALALKLRIPVTRVNDIVRGKRGITADTALRLAQCFGNSAEFWMNLQTAYELSRAREESEKAIKAEVLRAAGTSMSAVG